MFNTNYQPPVNIDTHEVKNNEGDYSTIGNVKIINSDTVEITFNNEKKFGKIDNGTKLWEILGEFETVREIHVAQRFITHCIENDDGSVNVEYFVLENISMLLGIVTIDHYVYETEDIDCVYPDIILDPPSGFD